MENLYHFSLEAIFPPVGTSYIIILFVSSYFFAMYQQNGTFQTVCQAKTNYSIHLNCYWSLGILSLKTIITTLDFNCEMSISTSKISIHILSKYKLRVEVSFINFQ